MQGKQERELCYKPMKDALIEYFAAVAPEARSSSQFCREVIASDDHPIRRTLRVLVPGAGLGRLAYDVAKLGMHISAHTIVIFNIWESRIRLPRQRILALHAFILIFCFEQVRLLHLVSIAFSLFLSLILSLDRTDEINKHTFYPYVHSLSNVLNKESVLRTISIPDVLPSDLPRGSNFSLVAGKSWHND